TTSGGGAPVDPVLKRDVSRMLRGRVGTVSMEMGEGNGWGADRQRLRYSRAWGSAKTQTMRSVGGGVGRSRTATPVSAATAIMTRIGLPRGKDIGANDCRAEGVGRQCVAVRSAVAEVNGIHCGDGGRRSHSPEFTEGFCTAARGIAV